MSEQKFEPVVRKLQRIRPYEPSYMRQVLAAAYRAGYPKRPRSRRPFIGSRSGRGSVAARMLGLPGRYSGLRQRQVFVKTKLVLLHGRGVTAARRHLNYIGREGAGRDGERGRLYSADEGPVDSKGFADGCDGDRHHFRLIVALDDGAQYENLSPLIRRFMHRMEEDLGTGLQWVAADHRDTLRPHTHILLRGKDDTGENLVISPEYIKHGMRDRLSGMVSIDLGPRTDYEVEPGRYAEVRAQRMTSIDDDLLNRMDVDRVVSPAGPDMLTYALGVGRLRKLERFGLAAALRHGEWQLSVDLEPVLERMGERDEMSRTIRCELKGAGIERAPAHQLIHPRGMHSSVIGKVVASGLAKGVSGTKYLILDGTDGRSHYVSIGNDEISEPLPNGAIVRIEPLRPTRREIDDKIAAIAHNNDGRYSIALHLRVEPKAIRHFVDAHARRLEELQARIGELQRAVDDSWSIPRDFIDLAIRHDSLQRPRVPLEIQLLSPLPLEQLPTHDGATWLDREIISREAPTRNYGFGREVISAIEARRSWLVEQDLGSFKEGGFFYQGDMLDVLEQRELSRIAAAIARKTGLIYSVAGPWRPIEGIVRCKLDLASGSFALIEKSREFTLVPWQPILARSMDQPVFGRLGPDREISWTLGRSLGLGR